MTQALLTPWPYFLVQSCCARTAVYDSGTHSALHGIPSNSAQQHFMAPATEPKPHRTDNRLPSNGTASQVGITAAPGSFSGLGTAQRTEPAARAKPDFMFINCNLLQPMSPCQASWLRLATHALYCTFAGLHRARKSWAAMHSSAPKHVRSDCTA